MFKLKNLLLKQKHRNSGMFVIIIILLQFTYVNFIGKKDQLPLSVPQQILTSASLNNEILQKRHIKPPTVSALSMSSKLNCQIQSSQIKCKEKNSAKESIITPPQLPVSISSTQNYSCLIDKDSEVQCWFQNAKTQNLSFSKIHLTAAAVQISSNNTETCSLLRTGEVFCWKAKDKIFTLPEKQILTDEAVNSISSYGKHHCATNESGNVICWGDHYTTPEFQISHIQIREKALLVSSGPNQDCIITKRRRELICWNADYSELSKAPDLENLHEVSLSANLSCGLTFDGSVYCWNQENLSSLKLQLNTESEASKLISMSSNNSEICGLTDDQRVICWDAIKK